MKSFLVSVIVPVYNVEKYLEECITSILLQSYTNFELILVDDGSTDCSGKLCDEFVKKDKRIKVIHKKNGGLSDARNAGIDVANGQFIMFVDSDDYIDKSYIEVMLNTMIRDGSDIVQCEFTQKTEEIGDISRLEENVILDSEHALKDMLSFGIVQVNAWAKLYKIDLFKEVRYPIGRINEDNLTTYKLLDQMQQISCVSQKLYFYRTNFEGIMNSRFSSKRYELLSFSNEISDYLGERKNLYKPYIDYAEMRIAIRLYNECIAKGCEKEFITEQSQTLELLKKYKMNSWICENKYRILIGILKVSKTFYKFCIKKFRV